MSEDMTEEEKNEKLMEFFEKHKKVKAEGFAGVLSNGRIVDRREYPEAIPMQKNSLLNIPEPKELPKDGDK